MIVDSDHSENAQMEDEDGFDLKVENDLSEMYNHEKMKRFEADNFKPPLRKYKIIERRLNQKRRKLSPSSSASQNSLQQSKRKAI